MKIIKDIEEIENLKLENTAVALGKFDGVHKGHNTIIDILCKEKTKGRTSLVFTFSKNPADGGDKKRLYTFGEQMLAYEKQGVDIVIVYPIESGILAMEADEFVKDVLVSKLGAKSVICGENFRFGHNRKGDAKLLRELGKIHSFSVYVAELVKDRGKTISSSIIRGLIKEGKMEEAKKLLGYSYSVTGEVVHGNQIGRTLGIPTANIIPEAEKLLPPNGVYKSSVVIDNKEYNSITNIGYKPTIKEKNKVAGLETHIFDFEGDLYGKIITVSLEAFVREEKRFSGIEELKAQLETDIVNITKTICVKPTNHRQ